LNEWDTPKEGEHFEKSKELLMKWIQHYETIVKEKPIKVIYDKIFTDNSGHFSNWTEYESMDDFKIIWDDETYQRYWAEFARYASNCQFRVMRPANLGTDM